MAYSCAIKTLVYTRTTMNQYPSNHNHSPQQQQLQELFEALQTITRNHEQALSGGVFSLNECTQEALLGRINPYCTFELRQYPELQNIPLGVTGAGLLFVADFDGAIMGVETIDGDSELTGTLSDVCAFPTPTVECLAVADENEVPVHDQILSPIINLQQVTLKTDRNEQGEFERIIDLANFQIGIPLEHYFQFTTLENRSSTP